MRLYPIHPFPARMAPEVVGESLSAVRRGGRVLDPMCGSGTVARMAAEAGLECVGVDIDPLSVLMASVWSAPIDERRLSADADDAVEAARALPSDAAVEMADAETRRFVSYWFAPQQRVDLARLATALRRWEGPTRNALALALSRIIISKEKTASLARDTSHSRPHRVAESSDFDVYNGFARSVGYISRVLRPNLIVTPARVRRGDARELDCLDGESFDLVLTSPPYLNAIDYLRGHRLALVWMGFDVAQLRNIRAMSIGAERMISESASPVDVSQFIKEKSESSIGEKHRGWIRRYAVDMSAVFGQIKRVVKRKGKVVMVLGNSFLRGALIDNAGLMECIAESFGFRVRTRATRNIPARRRYLPPPGTNRKGLDARMREETVLTFDIR